MIIISPYAKMMRNGKTHPKNYPWWHDVLRSIEDDLGYQVIQVGIEGEEQLTKDFRKGLSLSTLADLVRECDTWISVDSFFQHFAWDLGKKGVVLWGPSDPLIFGHPENVNLLKSRQYLRQKQFWMWEQCEANPTAFVRPEVVIKATLDLLNKA